MPSKTEAVICQADALTFLRGLPSGVAHACVTSPPYYQQRNYGVEGQIGLEPTIDEYVTSLVQVFAEVRRALHPDGILLLNLGDSYASRRGVSPTGGRLKAKDQLGVPWAVAFALRDAGWYLRQDLVWAKGVSFTQDRRPDVRKALLRQARKAGISLTDSFVEAVVSKAAPFVGNPMPQSTTDRCSSSHETVFLLSKSRNYFWDAEAIKEKDCGRPSGNDLIRPQQISREGRGNKEQWLPGAGRNARSVWLIPTKSDKVAHYAVMAPLLASKLIAVSTSEQGCCNVCGCQRKRVVGRERVPTRPGLDVKYLPKSDGGLATAATLQWSKPKVIGNRDPQRHVTRTWTAGWEATCECGGETMPSLVIDPFAGSGTTLVEAVRLGRRAWGCDLNPAYVLDAEKKISMVDQEMGVAA